MVDWLTKADVEHLKNLLRSSRESEPLHIEVTVITEWKTNIREVEIDHTETDGPPSAGKEYKFEEEQTQEIASTKKRTIHKSLISEAKKHEGYCILRIARKEGSNETITVTEPYEEIARKLCQNSQES